MGSGLGAGYAVRQYVCWNYIGRGHTGNSVKSLVGFEALAVLSALFHPSGIARLARVSDMFIQPVLRWWDRTFPLVLGDTDVFLGPRACMLDWCPSSSCGR